MYSDPSQNSESAFVQATEFPLSGARSHAPERPLNVCYLIDNLTPGGTELRLRRLIASLDRRRVNPILCLLDGESTESKSLEPEGCLVFRFGIKSLCRVSTWVKACQFLRILRRNKIDILETYFPDSTFWGVPIGRLAGVRIVFSTLFNLGYWLTPIRKFKIRIPQMLVDATLTNCRACAAVATRELGMPKERIVVLKNGIDLKPFQNQQPRTNRLRNDIRRIGMVANLREVKDPECFLRASRHVVRRHPHSRFVLAGSGDLYDSLLSIRESLGVKDQFELRGVVHDIPALLSELDVAVLSSKSEGSSNAILEYMAAGLPIVVTDVGGNSELIQHEENGLLVPVNSPTELGDAILRLLRDRRLADRLAMEAQRRAVELYSVEAMALRYQALYEAVTETSLTQLGLTRFNAASL